MARRGSNHETTDGVAANSARGICGMSGQNGPNRRLRAEDSATACASDAHELDSESRSYEGMPGGGRRSGEAMRSSSASSN
jgi:RNA polymerase-binding transcription factor DksA